VELDQHRPRRSEQEEPAHIVSSTPAPLTSNGGLTRMTLAAHDMRHQGAEAEAAGDRTPPPLPTVTVAEDTCSGSMKTAPIIR
jgi:hypothetical protein